MNPQKVTRQDFREERNLIFWRRQTLFLVPTYSSAQGLNVVPFGPRDDGYNFPSQLQLLFPGPHLRF
jgi:hypothetical protein